LTIEATHHLPVFNRFLGIGAHCLFVEGRDHVCLDAPGGHNSLVFNGQLKRLAGVHALEQRSGRILDDTAQGLIAG
jgi:hypothetical protein